MVESWLTSLGPCKPEGGRKAGGYTWSVEVSDILDLLSRYRSHEGARRADTRLLARYIKAQTEHAELVNWTVHLVSSGLAKAEQKPIRGLDVGLIKRAPFPKEQRPDRFIIRRLISPTDEKIDLTKAEQALALEQSVEIWKADTTSSKPKNAPTTPGGMQIRLNRHKSKGMLLIYPIDPKQAGFPEGTPPVIGVAISFPGSETAKEVTYTVNNLTIRGGGDDESY